MSARALVYVIAGHALHHRDVLAKRYGIGAARMGWWQARHRDSASGAGRVEEAFM